MYVMKRSKMVDKGTGLVFNQKWFTIPNKLYSFVSTKNLLKAPTFILGNFLVCKIIAQTFQCFFYCLNNSINLLHLKILIIKSTFFCIIDTRMKNQNLNNAT